MYLWGEIFLSAFWQLCYQMFAIFKHFLRYRRLVWKPELETPGEKAVRDNDFASKQVYFKDLYIAATEKGDESLTTTAFGQHIYESVSTDFPPAHQWVLIILEPWEVIEAWLAFRNLQRYDPTVHQPHYPLGHICLPGGMDKFLTLQRHG